MTSRDMPSRTCRTTIRSMPPRSARRIDAMYAEWIVLGEQVDALNAQRDGLRARLANSRSTGRPRHADPELTTETTRLEDRLVDLAPSVVTNMLNAPLLDFMAPTLTVRQVITPGIVDDVNFNMRVAKMDRCQSCHLAIDRVGYEEYPQPFTTHPNLDAYVGSSSSHPVGRFGCTVCHEGMGQSINFEYASHTPRDAEQMLQWRKNMTGGPASLGLPDASDRHDRGIVRQMPSGDDLRARGPRHQLGLWRLRARRVLRLPYHNGLSGPPQAWAEPDQDLGQAGPGLGSQLDSGPEGREIEHVDAAGLVQLE